MPYSIIFFGTSNFSTPSLASLIRDPRFSVLGVVTKPDMKIGRHQEIIKPPVKVIAEKNNTPVYQWEKIKKPEVIQVLQRIQEQTPIDAYVVVSYGKIIPQAILDIPKYGVVNVHGSLLPKYRGASCVQAAIAAGDKQTGVTVMLMDAEMDHGPILAQKTIPIGETETGGELHDRLAKLGAEVLPDVLSDFLDNKLSPIGQKHNEATYCSLLTRENGKIDWTRSADEIERLIRAYDSWPGTWTTRNEQRIKIINISRQSEVGSRLQKEVGTWFVEGQKLFVTCGGGSVLEILELQPEGKRIMNAQEYLAGNKLS